MESTIAQGTNGRAERIKEQEHEIGYYETLTWKTRRGSMKTSTS